MTAHDTTLVERLAGIAPESTLGRAYRARPEARTLAEDGYRTLLHPTDPGAVSVLERRAIAAFVAVLNGEAQTRAHFLGLLRDTDPTLALLVRQIEAEAEDAAHPGPYGSFPAGLSPAEDREGPIYQVDDALRDIFGPRLSAAFEHAHLITLHPRDARPRALEALADAGWTNSGIAVLLDLIGFVNFQSRIVAGLRGYAAARQSSLALHG